ncbi:ADP-ribose pyrophosphatase YjhB (NUDIX family) [Krasilnikovia cinnamomea]|uniref:ADP-ribose pyrophosphatase YjhB (NUDIX family) n=1 Tax=Krasilnikovia cinnamomea TaxID=349313 RepID=A0A4Q7Z907_9ACTN|nr:NUDIX hydrolase [Krasilnikovia cinnamomea]RZU46531.1 ADP-ribose pyrophosphatase YjhB (NUDIX family) [Krasilnikovia cinnamomea]
MERLEPAQWYASLPSFLASACMLITDPRGAVLAVKPNYRPWWNVPGGILEADEPPHECCAREVAEELGIQREVGRLLVLDWVPPNAQRRAWFGYVFDGGVLDDASAITLQSDELDAFTFFQAGQLREHLTANTADRIEAALQARALGGVVYLHNGVRVDPVSSVSGRG